MKHRILFSFFCCCLLVLSSCSAQSGDGASSGNEASIEKVAAKAKQPETEITGPCQCATRDDGASDIWWELQDMEGNPLPLRKIVADELADVRHVEPLVLQDCKYVVWFWGVKLRILNVAEQTISTLMSVHEDTEGISSLLTAPEMESRIAFVNFNPNRYPNGGKLFVLDLKGEEVERKLKFDCDIHFGVKGNSPYNSIVAGEDFWFEGKDVVKYRQNPMTTDPRLQFGDWDVLTYPFKVKSIPLPN